MLVTKTLPAERVREAYGAGIRDFGENRAQELIQKKPELPPDIRWHFQGHLQTNKVKFLLGEIALLHSLDRMALAEEIQKQAEKRNLSVEALIQVNVSGEATKSGFAPEEMEEVMGAIQKLSRIKIHGLMTIGPTPVVGAAPRGRPKNGGQPQGAPTNEEAVRTCFRKLRLLRDQLQRRFPDVSLQELSMGMSSDFEAAIEEGATIVRIGTAVFGESF